MHPVKEYEDRLFQAGWFISTVPCQTPDGPAWLVTGTLGTNRIEACAVNKWDAWEQVYQQAEARGHVPLLAVRNASGDGKAGRNAGQEKTGQYNPFDSLTTSLCPS